MSLLIKNGRILDPENSRDLVADLLVSDEGKIVRIQPDLEYQADEVYDATGKLVTPGLVDMHVHLREPGREDSENIASGSRAAAAGGFTSICPMPNTHPPVDDAQGLQFLTSRARECAVVNIHPIAAVTEGLEGEAITEFGDLVYYGAVAFSQGGRAIMNNEIMRRALEYTSMFDVPILDHCEDTFLAEGGQMRDGAMATRLGLKGIPYAAESILVARDIDLANYTGGRVHICQCSVKRSIDYIRSAKERDIRITCEATPHHLTLLDEDMADYDTALCMSPPLGSRIDRRGLLDGLRDGTIDVIATGHAPHTDMDKDHVFVHAQRGVIGLETAFPVVYTKLVRQENFDLAEMLRKMTVNPARILKLDKGTLGEGKDADIAVFDLDSEYTVDPEKFQSRSHNCPWNGQTLSGRAVATFVGGKQVWNGSEIMG